MAARYSYGGPPKTGRVRAGGSGQEMRRPSGSYEERFGDMHKKRREWLKGRRGEKKKPKYPAYVQAELGAAKQAQDESEAKFQQQMANSGLRTSYNVAQGLRLPQDEYLRQRERIVGNYQQRLDPYRLNMQQAGIAAGARSQAAWLANQQAIEAEKRRRGGMAYGAYLSQFA